MQEWLFDASSWVLPVLLAITLHEAAHGWMAEKFGDSTARLLGRVTFNPLQHIDRFGTIILPGLLLIMQSPALFGYAKPVPVNFYNLQPPRFGQFMVAIAGVLVNLALMVISALLLHLEGWLRPEEYPWLFQSLYKSLMINAVLIVFNLIPLLPLDGGRTVDAWLPDSVRHYYRKTERIGIPVLFLLLLLPMLFDYPLLQQWLGPLVFGLIEGILWLTGVASPG